MAPLFALDAGFSTLAVPDFRTSDPGIRHAIDLIAGRIGRVTAPWSQRPAASTHSSPKGGTGESEAV